jgi:hypothetical protein
MAVRKKSKRPSRKATRRARPSRKVTPRRKARKAVKRTARKRVRPALRKAKMRKVVSGVPVPALAPATKYFDDFAAPRCRSRILVEIEVAGRTERGAIVDMSSTGARIVGISKDLAPGTPLQIRYPSGIALLAAEIVRATEDGFAVRIFPKAS